MKERKAERNKVKNNCTWKKEGCGGWAREKPSGKLDAKGVRSRSGRTAARFEHVTRIVTQ